MLPAAEVLVVERGEEGGGVTGMRSSVLLFNLKRLEYTAHKILSRTMG